MRTIRQVWPLALLALLAACGGEGAVKGPGTVAPPVKRVTPRAPQRHAPPPPQVHALPVPGVIGATNAELVSQFGAPRLDVWEGDARKLQYAGPACVLDIYLYPAAPGREPQATYVDARRASDGQDVDRTACIAALRTRARPQP